jgi:hypothetical protein
VKMENPSACVTVNWKLRKSAIALYLSVIKRTCNRSAINPIIRNRTRYFHHTYPHTRDILVSEVGDSDHIGFIGGGYDLKICENWC